jgi:hypothetical protein
VFYRVNSYNRQENNVEPNPGTTPEIVTRPPATIETGAGWASAVEGQQIPDTKVTSVATAIIFLAPNL